jgi:hypothetical protein
LRPERFWDNNKVRRLSKDKKQRAACYRDADLRKRADGRVHAADADAESWYPMSQQSIFD